MRRLIAVPSLFLALAGGVCAQPEESAETPEIRIVSRAGDTALWPAFVIAAPHGDFDARTGWIVEQLHERTGIPVVVAYNSRISAAGRWIDANRPLQRLPNKLFELREDRQWTPEAEDVYLRYRAGVLAAPGDSRNPAGEPPIDIYLDFHGHGLMATNAAGQRVRRNVFECVARGFTLEEVRELKFAFDTRVTEQYGEDAPPSYWVNIPGDEVYDVEGTKVRLAYGAIESRVLGTLASDVAYRAIHIEAPNRLRVEEATRLKVPALLESFAIYLRDEVTTKTVARNQAPSPRFQPSRGIGDWVAIPEGVYTISLNEDGDREPRHFEAFEIAQTETTNREFAEFVTRSVKSGVATIQNGQVIAGGLVWASLWPEAPVSVIAWDGEACVVRPGREDHPVMEVSWHGADAFARASGARLPTTFEWEVAAIWNPADNRRAPSATGEPIGNSMRATFMHGEHAPEAGLFPWTTPVGHHDPASSPFGCYDMAGNAWEWTADWYITSEESEAEGNHTMREIRGGGWDTESRTMKPEERLYAAPHATLPNVGFRIARDAPRLTN